jgi:hypothetical protein
MIAVCAVVTLLVGVFPTPLVGWLSALELM